MPPPSREAWASGDAYEPYIGRWSRLVAREFLVWLNSPRNSRWLDVGCGTGALTQTILSTQSPAHVNAVDASADFVAFARDRVADSHATFAVADARALPPDMSDHDAAVSGLVLNFIPDPAAAVAEMTRALKPGGVVAAYVWDYASGMQLIRYFWDAAIATDASAAELDEGRRFPLCQPYVLERVFRDVGLLNVETRAIDVPTRFEHFDDLWRPFLGGQGPAPTYVTQLDERRRNALRDELRTRLPIERDGSIVLTARAWAVRGARSP